MWPLYIGYNGQIRKSIPFSVKVAQPRTQIKRKGNSGDDLHRTAGPSLRWWEGGSEPAAQPPSPAGSVRPARGVHKTRQDKYQIKTCPGAIRGCSAKVVQQAVPRPAQAAVLSSASNRTDSIYPSCLWNDFEMRKPGFRAGYSGAVTVEQRHLHSGVVAPAEGEGSIHI
jgi:hypothetical protein